MKGLKLLKIQEHKKSIGKLNFNFINNKNPAVNLKKMFEHNNMTTHCKSKKHNNNNNNSPLDPLEPLLLVLPTHEQPPAPGSVNMQPDPVRVTNI